MVLTPQEQMPDDVFSPLLITYLEGLKGVSRTKTLEEAKEIVKAVEQEDSQDTRYDRAIKVVTSLEDE